MTRAATEASRRLSRPGQNRTVGVRFVDQANRRVVVTGMGMVTPVGLDVESSWEAMREGRGGVGPVTLFDAQHFRDAYRRGAQGLRSLA